VGAPNKLMKRLFLIPMMVLTAMAQMTVTGTPSLKGNSNLTITPPTADFIISISPTSAVLTQGSSTNVTVTITSLNGFISPVTLSAAQTGNFGTGISFSFSPVIVTPPSNGSVNSTLTISATGGAQTPVVCSNPVSTPPYSGLYSVTGTSGSNSHINATPCFTMSASGGPYILTMTDTGSGTVTSSPAGINCGSTCSASFTSGTNVTLTETPAAGGWVFGSWGGDCSGTGTTTSITMSANHNCTATWMINAQLPTAWVNSGTTTNNGFCSVGSAPGGVYTVTKHVNGTDYPQTLAGLQSALSAWATDGNTASWWHIIVPAGALLTGTTYDSNKALWTWPAKAGATGCAVIESDNPPTAKQMLCSHGLPVPGGGGGTRNPGCTNDIAHLFTIRDDNPITGNNIIYACASQFQNFGNATCGQNHIVLRDAELTIKPGTSQSSAGLINAVILVHFESGPDHLGVEYSYLHGWDPGDAGQPGAGSGNPAVNNATGACLMWDRSGHVMTASNGGGQGTVTWLSHKVNNKETSNQFGMDFSDGTHSAGYPQVMAGQNNALNINGVPYSIVSHDPGASSTVLTVSPDPGAQGDVTYTMENPATRFKTGCGDDIQAAAEIHANNSYFQFNYIEKIHAWNTESHALTSGFNAGPYKFTHNWVEGSAADYFSGGSAVDLRGGPGNNGEIRGNFFGADLNYRFLTGNSGNSPGPPFGCGPFPGQGSANSTCPMTWGFKNKMEMKLGISLLVDGNIIDGDWSDGQTGSIILHNVRTTSGGTMAGVYDPITGLPITVISNLRVSNNWIRNSPQAVQMAVRSGTPGNGGGVSLPADKIDYYNNVFSNISDNNQWGSPGNDLFEWGGGGKGAPPQGGGQAFQCTMSRTSGVANATCLPLAASNANPNPSGQSWPVIVGAVTISYLARTSGTVTMKLKGLRSDPTIGGTVIVTGYSGFNGTFTVSGVQQSGVSTTCNQANNTQPQPCVGPQGQFGDTITYTDNTNPGDNAGCQNLHDCNLIPMVVTVPTLAYNVTDIQVGDYIYVYAYTPSAPCTGGYAVGVTAPPVAVTGTNPAGLTVAYANPGSDDNTGVVCVIENSPGHPSNTHFVNNTVLSVNQLVIANAGPYKQQLNNHFEHNIFITTGGKPDVLKCTSTTGEGTGSNAPFSCWDNNTSTWFDNVMQGRNSADWGPVPSTAAANPVPALATCTVYPPPSTCLGFTGYTPSPGNGLTFPTSNCTYDGSDPTNCPLMALPWKDNFRLDYLVPIMGSSYSTEGANITNIKNAFTSTQYVCPYSCGSPGPFPD
jgi:hypothetical protein